MFRIFSKAPQKRIELFVRHCHFSPVSQHKGRFPNYSRKKCHDNLLATLDDSVNVTYLLDAFYPTEEEHFIRKYPIIEIKEGTETGSFLKLLDLLESLKLKPETIVYFLEDDYLHRPDWPKILREAFTIPGVDYATLYDHKDKYFSYPDLTSKIYHTESCHWRTTPSTTNTYAMKYKTLLEHMPIHREFSLNRKVSDDHGKFCKLREMGATLISSIPGYSTHCEPDLASPCYDWATQQC